MTLDAGPGWCVRVPASSANLGPGFDVLGMALTLHATVGPGAAPPGAVSADEHHPATVAFRRLGGEGPLWVRSPIPMGRGLGYSGAVRVGGALAALVARRAEPARFEPPSTEDLATALEVTTELEGHADNVAASLYGGVVVAAGGHVGRAPLALDPAVVAWVPSVTTSTDRSRAVLPATVDRADAVFNLGRLALLLTALATGEVDALREATADRLHQPMRLAEVPGSAAALAAGLAAGAWCGWLSGSGPTVALLCPLEEATRLAATLPAEGHTKILRIDHQGAVVTAPETPAESDPAPAPD
jgi:homoserine kinase